MIALGFLANMAFVIVSRTALVTIPIMLAVFAVLHLRWQTTLMILCAAVVACVIAWAASPLLQERISSIGLQYQLYEQQGATTSVGERLEFWRKSLRFFVEAPIVGHGTGRPKGYSKRPPPDRPALPPR